MPFDLFKPILNAVGSRSSRVRNERPPEHIHVPLSGDGFAGNAPALSRSLRLLLAEDNPINQKLALTVLKKQGFDIVLADDGHEAVDAYSKAIQNRVPFDIILMDIQMPNMNGFEAAKTIRDLEKTSGTHTPIVALTAHARREDEEECLSAGMDAFISKPIRTHEVGARVRELVGPVEESESEAPLSKGSEEPVVPTDVFNRNGLLEALGGDESYVEELVDLFLDNEEEYMDSIRAAVETSDVLGLRAAAHTLQGVLASIQATSSRRVACRLEDISVTGDVENAPKALAELDIEMERLRSALAHEA